jgi:site-specific recombinase XerD
LQYIISISKELNKYKHISNMGTPVRTLLINLLEICRKVAEDAGITTRAFLHKFRHTYATLLIQRGTPIESIKELLGHWSVVQTEAYAHNNTEHLLPQASRLNKLLGDN